MVKRIEGANEDIEGIRKLIGAMGETISQDIYSAVRRAMVMQKQN